eukprot:TRINITY_DN3295_c3_g4_i3.p2 TRINITY_DN3295_c3_g4~~TRINITY_DN3295_c3_g4_i3.p2  ORF type:complete len:227 (+),score=20.90 TRINITY_DN3295_c3_g4_i3:187-867(+)
MSTAKRNKDNMAEYADFVQDLQTVDQGSIEDNKDDEEEEVEEEELPSNAKGDAQGRKHFVQVPFETLEELRRNQNMLMQLLMDKNRGGNISVTSKIRGKIVEQSLELDEKKGETFYPRLRLSYANAAMRHLQDLIELVFWCGQNLSEDEFQEFMMSIHLQLGQGRQTKLFGYVYEFQSVFADAVGVEATLFRKLPAIKKKTLNSKEKNKNREKSAPRHGESGKEKK